MSQKVHTRTLVRNKDVQDVRRGLGIYSINDRIEQNTFSGKQLPEWIEETRLSREFDTMRKGWKIEI